MLTDAGAAGVWCCACLLLRVNDVSRESRALPLLYSSTLMYGMLHGHIYVVATVNKPARINKLIN